MPPIIAKHHPLSVSAHPYEAVAVNSAAGSACEHLRVPYLTGGEIRKGTKGKVPVPAKVV